MTCLWGTEAGANGGRTGEVEVMSGRTLGGTDTTPTVALGHLTAAGGHPTGQGQGLLPSDMVQGRRGQGLEAGLLQDTGPPIVGLLPQGINPIPGLHLRRKGNGHGLGLSLGHRPNPKGPTAGLSLPLHSRPSLGFEKREGLYHLMCLCLMTELRARVPPKPIVTREICLYRLLPRPPMVL